MQPANNSNSLGSAEGKIVINLDQFEAAVEAVRRGAAQMQTAMQSISKSSGAGMEQAFAAMAAQVAKVNSSMAETVRVQQQSASQTQREIGYLERRLALEEQIKRSKEQQSSFVGGLRQELGGGGGGGAGQQAARATMPAFLQFSLYPIAGLATSAGAPALASGAMTAASTIGVVESLSTLRGQLIVTAENLRNAGGVVGMFAAKIGSVFGASGTMANAIGTLAGIAIPATLAIVGIGAAISDMQRRAQEAAQEVQKTFQQRLDMQAMIASGTTSAEAQAQYQNMREQVGARYQEMELLRPFVDRYNNLSVSNSQNGVIADTKQINLELAEATRGAYTDVAALAGQFPVLEAGVSGLGEEIDILYEAIRTGAFAANDMRAELLATIPATDAMAKARINAEVAVKNMTAQQIRDRLDSLRNEGSAIESNYRRLSVEEQQLADIRLGAIAAEGNALREGLSGAIWRDLTTNIANVFQQGMQMAADYGLQLTRTREDRGIQFRQGQEDRGIRQGREGEDFARRRAQQGEDFNRELGRFDADFRRQQAKTQEEYQKETLAREKDFQDRMARILAESRISILESAARLDARGVYEQQRRRNQQIAELNKDNETEKQKRAENFREQLEEQREQYERQRAERLEDFNRQLTREDQERAIRASREANDYTLGLQRQAQAYQLQDSRRAQDYQLQVNRLLNHNTTMQGIAQTGYNLIEFLFRGHINSMAAAVTPAPAPTASVNPNIGFRQGFSAQSDSAAGGGVYVDMRGANMSGFSPEAFEEYLRAFFTGGAAMLMGRR